VFIDVIEVIVYCVFIYFVFVKTYNYVIHIPFIVCDLLVLQSVSYKFPLGTVDIPGEMAPTHYLYEVAWGISWPHGKETIYFYVWVTFHAYLCLYVYIRNTLGTLLEYIPKLHDNYSFHNSPSFTCLHCKGRMRTMWSNCYSYAIFIQFCPDFIFLIMPKSNHIMIF
jgi:hypothetical protein